MALTAAPRSAVVHVIDRTDSGRTWCGRPIGDTWAGEYDEAPAGPATCQRCIAREEAAQADLEARAAFRVGQRVGLLRGFLAQGGPAIYDYGTVAAVREYWRGTFSYIVTADNNPADSGVWEAYMLSDDVSGDPARRAVMERHPAGKGRVVPGHSQDTFPGGWSVRRSAMVSRDARVIMASREMDWHGEEYPREYVIAVHYVTATEWTNGTYSFDMVRADRLFRERVAAWEK